MRKTIQKRDSVTQRATSPMNARGKNALFAATLGAAALLMNGCNRSANTEIARDANAAHDNAATAMPTSRLASTRGDLNAPVWIDIAALARRHPAWRLADSLQRATGAANADAQVASTRDWRATNPSRPRLPQTATRTAIPALPVLRAVQLSANNDFGAAPLASTRNENSFLPPPAREYSPPREEANSAEFSSNFGTLTDAMANRQSVAVARFFSVTQQRMAARREQLRDDLLAALNDDIAADTEFAASQSTVPPTFLPPPEVQLEMTNLRLQLVPNARTTAAQREIAAARLASLESVWRARVEDSLDTWLANRRRNLEERPRQLKSEGLQRIAQTLGALQSTEISQRATLRETQLELLARDFGAQPFFSPADATFGDTLFAFNRFDAPRFVAPRSVASRGNGTRTSETSRVLAASTSEWHDVNTATQRRDFSVLSPPPNASRVLAAEPSLAQRQARIALLRERALRETSLWARIAARRGGWKNVAFSTAPNAPRIEHGARNVTGEAARILQLP